MALTVRPSVIDGARVSLDSLIALRQEARRLRLTPRGQVLATRSGGHLSHFRGRGMEFDESRIYQPGDDPGNMDWRVTARSGRPHVKLFREERERPVWLLVDSTEAMHFGTRVAFKSVVAAQAAALLGWAAVDKGDRLGGLVFSETGSVQRKPSIGNRGLLPLLKALTEEPLRGNASGYHALPAAAQQLMPAIRPGSLVFLVSDFAALRDEHGAWLSRLARANEVVCIRVFDPIEMAAPPSGRYPVTDGVQHGVLDTAVGALRSGWAQRFRDQSALLQALCRRYRMHQIDLCTDQSPGEILHRGLGLGPVHAEQRPQGQR